MFQYKVVNVETDQLETTLNALAADGWEFVGITAFGGDPHFVVILKKPT